MATPERYILTAIDCYQLAGVVLAMISWLLERLMAHTGVILSDLNRVPKLISNCKTNLLDRAFSGALTQDWRKMHPDVAPVCDQLFKVRRSREKDPRLSRRMIVQTVPNSSLPKGWEWISPDEIADDSEYSIGIGPFGSNLVRTDYRDKGVRLIFVRDIRREVFDDADARYVTIQKARELRQHIVRGDEVLITKMGNPPGDTVIP